MEVSVYSLLCDEYHSLWEGVIEVQEGTTDPEAAQVVTEGSAPVDGSPKGKAPSARRGRLGSAGETPAPAQEEEEEVEVSTQMEVAAQHTPAVAQDTVLGGVTIRELEMMRKMDELQKLEEIPVGGTTNIEAEVIASIAGVAAQSVDGVAALGTASLRRALRERLAGAERRARGIEVEAGRREVILDINMRVVYGYGLPKVVAEVRYVVADRLLHLCGLIAKEINIRVTGLEFSEKTPGRVD